MPFSRRALSNFKMVATSISEPTDVAIELPGEVHSPQSGSGAPGLNSVSLPSTSINTEAGKAHRKGSKATAKSVKARKSSKSSSRFERQKDKALERICKKASSKKTPSSQSADKRQHSQGRLALQLSPEGREVREDSLNSIFSIDVSGIWGSAQDVQTPLPPRDYAQQPSTGRMDAFPATSAGLCPNQLNPLSMPTFQDIIANAVSQGIVAGLK